MRTATIIGWFLLAIVLIAAIGLTAVLLGSETPGDRIEGLFIATIAFMAVLLLGGLVSRRMVSILRTHRNGLPRY